MVFKITMGRYDLAQCAGIDLYEVHPSQRNWQQLKKDIDLILNHIGLKLTSKPYWLQEWDVVSVDGWSRPAQLLFESHWHFCSTAGYKSKQEQEYIDQPVHVFVDQNIGYLKYTKPGAACCIGKRGHSGDKKEVIAKLVEQAVIELA